VKPQHESVRVKLAIGGHQQDVGAVGKRAAGGEKLGRGLPLGRHRRRRRRRRAGDADDDVDHGFS